MPDTALAIRGVTKRFGSFTAVDDLSLSIPQGSIYGFLGPNGAGKTTTIRMIMSIFFPDQGEIEVLGTKDTTGIKDRLGYLPEEKGLYKKMRVQEIVAYFGKLKGMSSSDANRRSKELLERYGLGDWLDKRCEAMSKGMGQKVQLLGTIIHDPELVILDEPFSGLDPVNMELMRQTILDMKRDGRTVIFSTHVMRQAEEICDYIFLINKGKKVLDGPLADVRRGEAGGVEHGIQLEYDGDGARLREIEGIARFNDAGKAAELFLKPGVDAQQVLAQILQRVTVRKFDLSEPSLHEIFVRAVGGEVTPG
jgi:ABC-2 type transport system ATP-binding protein